MRKRHVWIVAALAVGLLTTFGAVAPVAAQGEARVRLLHGSGDTPPVDVYLDGQQVVSSLAFTQASAYLPITTGRHTFQVFVNGVRPGAGRPLTTVEDVNIPANARLTVVAVGFLVDMRWLMVDDQTAPPTDGKAKARVIHASLFAPSLDVATRGGAPLFSNTVFDEVTAYRAFDARQYDFEIRPAMQAGNVFLSTVTFAPNTAYSLYVLNATTVRAFVDAQGPAGSQPTAVRDAPGPAITAVPAMATAVAAISPQLPAATLQPIAAASPETVISAEMSPLMMGIPQGTAPAMMGVPATQRPANTVVPVATRAATPVAIPVAMPVTGRGSSDGIGFPLLVLGVLAGVMVARVGVAVRHMARHTLH